MTTTTPRPAGPQLLDKSPITYDDAIDSMTGHDELQMSERFAIADVYIALSTRTTMVGRALAMTVIARDLRAQDVKDPSVKAYKRVMDMTLKEVTDFWPEIEPEVDPDNPITDVGKDDSATD